MLLLQGHVLLQRMTPHCLLVVVLLDQVGV
jgi:hypothetical protein